MNRFRNASTLLATVAALVCGGELRAQGLRHVGSTNHLAEYAGGESDGNSLRRSASKRPVVREEFIEEPIVEEIAPVQKRKTIARPASTTGTRKRAAAQAKRAAYEVGHMHHDEGEVIWDDHGGETIVDEIDAEFGESCGPDCNGCEHCDGEGLPSCFSLLWQRMEFISGVQSFSGPANRGGTGSFGFHEGLNFGSPLLHGWHGLGVQAGANVMQSNLNGSLFTTDQRTQVFVTAGLFRRVDWGLQGGLVVDYMHDDWYYSVDLTQLRGELSWVTESGADIGFMFSAGMGDDRTAVTTQTAGAAPVVGLETFSVTNLNAIFMRNTFCNGGQARLFAGFTGDSDGLLGADGFMPFTESCGIRAAVTYLIPQEGRADNGAIEESWNLGFTFVWRPGCSAACGRDYYRPLFNVADNGSMMVDRQ